MRRMGRGVALAAAVAGAGMAIAPAAAMAQAKPGMIPPSGAYRVEPDHTEILWSVDHMGFTTYHGVFSGASGRLTLDAEHPERSVLEVSVPIASVLTPSEKLSEELRGAQWLDAHAFPAATFHSTRIVRTGPNSADIDGELSLHGVTAPMTLHATFKGAGTNPLSHAVTAGFSATGVVKRSAFGVKTYVPLIGDDVELRISGAFEKTGA